MDHVLVQAQSGYAASVQLRHLRGQAEIRQVLHLREGIDLSVHTAGGRNFVELEKKEMSSVSSAPLNSTTPSSEPFGSCPWGMT